MKMTAEESLLRRLGVDFQAPAPGCCGMAGSFGFEHDKYDVSAAIGELELLPAVRQAPPDWLIIADGFSCREQIAQGTGRHALHLAEVLQMALQPSALDIDDPYPESRSVREQQNEVTASMKRAALGAGAVAAACSYSGAQPARANRNAIPCSPSCTLVSFVVPAFAVPSPIHPPTFLGQ